MPIVSYPEDNMDQAITPIDLRPKEEQRHSANAGDVIGAAFRQENIVASSFADKTSGIDLTAPDESFSSERAWKEIEGTPYEQEWDRFAPVMNQRGFEAMKAQIDMEREDRRILDASGMGGMAASFGAAMFDLPSLIPGGTLIRGATTGATVLRTALSTGAAGALAGGVSETALQATQQVRPAIETAIGIGSGAVLGGFLGAGAGAFFSRAQRKAALRAVDNAEQSVARSDQALNDFEEGIAEYTNTPESVGAAAAPVERLEDYDIAKGAKTLGKSFGRLNPVLRAAHSPSTVHRGIMADLQETGFYLEKNVKGEGNIAVESAVKYWDRGALGASIKRMRNIYSKARKGGYGGSGEVFRTNISHAMRRGDQSEDTAAAEAARVWRSKLFDPLKDEAVATGFLPEDVNVKTATSYLSRLWNRNKLEAGEQRFKQITRNWLSNQIRELELRMKEAETAPRAEGEKQSDLPEFVSDADRQDYIDEVTNNIFNQLTGRARAGDLSYDMVMTTRGPMKERSFNIPDELIEEFLEDDIEMIGRRYARVMSADIELSRMSKRRGFNGKPDLADMIAAVQEDYRQLREKAANSDASPAAKEALRKDLNARERRDVDDIAGIRDILRGQYKIDQQHSNFARISNIAMTLSYVRALGGVVISSLSDAVRPAMVHGVGRYMNEGVAPLITNLKGIKMSRADGELLGAVTERVLQSRIATLAELADPYAMSSPTERFFRNMANIFSKMTLLDWWNDFQKTISSTLVQNRILKNSLADFGKLPAKEKKYMGFVGIDEDMASRVRAQFEEFGQVEGNVHVANLERWTDAEAKRAYSSAVNKDVDSTIVTKGAGDTPLMMHTPAGRTLLQFRSFAIASNQRVTMRGLQDGPSAVLTGLIGMTAVGALIYYLKQKEAGREVSNNIGTWVAEGVDRAGFISIPMELSNTWEKVGGPGLYMLAAEAGKLVNPNADEKQPASRFAIRSVPGAMLGPVFGMATDAISLAGVGAKTLSGEEFDLTAGDVGAARRMAPFASLPYWRWLIDGIAVPWAKEAVQ